MNAHRCGEGILGVPKGQFLDALLSNLPCHENIFKYRKYDQDMAKAQAEFWLAWGMGDRVAAEQSHSRALMLDEVAREMFAVGG